MDLVIKIRADLPKRNNGVGLKMLIPMPKTVANASCINLGQRESFTFDGKQKILRWELKKFEGGTERTIMVKGTFDHKVMANKVRKEVGPITMSFEVPLYNPSRLQVRFLQIPPTQPPNKPHRWVRYVTKAESYSCRI
jgi:AP-4 complex subunit mu-1